MKNALLKSIAVFSFIVGAAFFVGSPAQATSISGGTSLSDPYCVSFDSEAEYDANISVNYTLGFFSTDIDGYVVPFTPISTTFDLLSGQPQLGPLCFPLTGLDSYNLVDWPNGLSFGPYQLGTQSYMNIWAFTDFMTTYITNIENNPTPTSTPFDEQTDSLFGTIVDSTVMIGTKILTEYWPYLLVFTLLFSLAAWIYRAMTNSIRHRRKNGY